MQNYKLSETQIAKITEFVCANEGERLVVDGVSLMRYRFDQETVIISVFCFSTGDSWEDFERPSLESEQFNEVLDKIIEQVQSQAALGKRADRLRKLGARGADWQINRRGSNETSLLLTVEDQMEYEQVPETRQELKELAQVLADADGVAGYYMQEPDVEQIEREILYWIVENQLYGGKRIAKEIAEMILVEGIDVGAWEKELKEFAGQEQAPAAKKFKGPSLG